MVFSGLGGVRFSLSLPYVPITTQNKFHTEDQLLSFAREFQPNRILDIVFCRIIILLASSTTH